MCAGHGTYSKGCAEAREAAPTASPKPSLMEAKGIAAGNRVPATVLGEEAALPMQGAANARRNISTPS